MIARNLSLFLFNKFSAAHAAAEPRISSVAAAVTKGIRRG